MLRASGRNDARRRARRAVATTTTTAAAARGRRRRPDGETTLRRRGASVVAAASSRGAAFSAFSCSVRTYEAARYPGIIIIDSTSPRDWCRMQREQQQRADRERRKEHVRAVRPRQNATAAATEETVPIETTRRGCRCRRELRPSGRYEVRREKRGKRTNGRRTRGMTRKKTVNRGNI